MRKSDDAQTLRVESARKLKHVNKQLNKDTGIVEANVLIEEDVYTSSAMKINDIKRHDNHKDESVPDISVYNNGNDTETYPVNNLLYCCGGSIRDVDQLGRDCLSTPAKYLQHSENSYPGITYDIVRRHFGKRFCKIKKTQYVHLYCGNDFNKTELELTKVNNAKFNKGNNVNKFVSMPAAKARRWAKLNVCYESGDDEEDRRKLGISSLYNNRNNSRYLNDSGSDADNDNEVERSNVDGSEWEDAQSGAGKDSECEQSHCRDETGSVSSVTPAESDSKCDSKNEESKETEDKNMAAHSETEFLSDGSSEKGNDTECSVDFENISGSVFWSEGVSNDNHIDDDNHNADDNNDTTFCENTVNEEINDFFLRNCAAARAGDNRKQHSPGSIGLSADHSAARKRQQVPFLDNDQGILGSSTFRGTIFPSLIRGKPSMPLKIMSLTSNPFDNYKRMFDALKARIFSNINEKNTENGSAGEDRGCVRRSVSIINNESMCEKSRVLHISSSDSDICKVDNNEKSTSSSSKDSDETYRPLPAWCDWEGEFDCDYRGKRSHKDLTVLNCVELTSNISRENLGQEDASKKPRDQGKQERDAKSKHFSSCKPKRGNGTSSTYQEKRANIVNKSTTKGQGKKKQINFKFQGPPKDIRGEFMNNIMYNVQTSSTAPSEEDRKDGRHQTSTVSSVAGKSASLLSQENHTVIMKRDSADIGSSEETEESQESETISKDCQKELHNRKDTLKNDNRERTNRKTAGVTKHSKPSDENVQDSEVPVAALAVFKASPDSKKTTSEASSDRTNKEYSLSGAHSYLIDTEQTQTENINRPDRDTQQRLMSSELDNKAVDAMGSSSVEIRRANGDMQSEIKQKDPGSRVRSLSHWKKAKQGSHVAIRHFKDVTHTGPQEKTVVKSTREWAKTTTPNIFKVVSNLSPRSVSSPHIEVIRPRYSILGSKAHKRHHHNQKSGKSKDNIHNNWLGKTNVQVIKPNKSPRRQTKVKKSWSENSLNAVTGTNITDVRPKPALPSSGEHRCYLEVQNRHKLSSIDRINGTSVDVEQSSTRIGSSKMNNKDSKALAEDSGVKMIKSVRNDFDYYYFQNMPSATSPDTEKNTSTSSPGTPIPSRKENHPSSEIYFITIPKRHTSETDCSARSPKNSHSLTDVYFSRNPNKYELLEESILSEEEYPYSHADVTTGQDVDCTLASLNYSSDVKCQSSGQDEDISTKDSLFYDDCLLDLINKRAVMNTANQETLTKIIFSNETGKDFMNTVPGLKQTLTISDLLAESMCLPSGKINPVEVIVPEVNLIEDFENALGVKRQRKRRRNKRKPEQGVTIPPNGENSMGDNEKIGNAQSECDKKTPRCQETAGGNVAQSIVMAAAEDTTFETKLMNYENPHFRKFRKSDTDFRSAVRSSNVKSNTFRESDHSPSSVEQHVTRESKQFNDHEQDPNLNPDNNDELFSQYSSDSEESDDDEYECNPKLQHKLALLLQRIEDTNCIKIVSTQEFYKKKHGTTSFLNDLAQMIDRNLEKCNESEQENANNKHIGVANELVASSSPSKVSKKEKACGRPEKQGAKKAQDCAGGSNHTDNKHFQFDEKTEGGEGNSLQTMGPLARHVRKQISDMHRLTDSDDMSLSEPDNVLCAYAKEHRSSHDSKKETKATGKRIRKGSGRNESKQPRRDDDTETAYRLRKLEAKKNTCNDSLLSSATAGGNARRNGQYIASHDVESSKMQPGKMQGSLYNKNMFSDCSDGSIKTKREYDQGGGREEETCKKVSHDDDYYDSDSKNLEPASSNSSVPTFRVTDVHKRQPSLNADFPRDEFHARKDAQGSQIYPDQASKSRNTPVLGAPGDSEVAGHKDSMLEYTCTNVHSAENETLHEAAKKEGTDPNVNLISASTDKNAFKNTPCDAFYWHEGVAEDAKVDAKCLATDESKIGGGYEKYKQLYMFNYASSHASSHTKQKVLKTIGTQYDAEETSVEKSKQTYTMAGVMGSSSDIYFHIQEKLSPCGSDENISGDSSLCQSHTDGSPLFEIAIPQELSCIKGQVSTMLPKLDFPKPKKNVTFQEDENREAIKKNTSDKQIDINHNDGSISNNRRTVEPQDSRVHNNEFSSRIYSKNSTVINRSQQTHHITRGIRKTLEPDDRPSLHSCEYDDREISRPGFVSYIHKHRRHKSEREAVKGLTSVSSTDTLSYQQSKNNRATIGNNNGTITHEPSRKDNQLSRIGVNNRKDSLIEKSKLQNQNLNLPKEITTNVCCRHDTDQGTHPSGSHQFLEEDCVKHSIANLNSNDKSEDRVQKYADAVNKPLYSLTCSPKASVEYAISGKSKLDDTNKTKVIPKPRVDLGSTHLQRNHGVSEVAKQSLEITREEFKMPEVKLREAKNGHKVNRNEREMATSGFKVAGNESGVARNGLRGTSGNSGIAKSGQRVASNEPGIVRSGHRVASNESGISTNAHKAARNEPVVIQSGLNMAKNESDVTKTSLELFTHPANRILPHSGHHSSQDTARAWTIDHLSMSKLGAGKRRPVSPFIVTPTRDREVNSSRSVSCHDMHGNPQTREEQAPKQKSNYTFNHHSPTCLYPKRNIRDIHKYKTQGNETAVSPTMLPTKSPGRNDHEIGTPMSCKSFRGNPRDIDDLLVTREYSSEGFFIPESDEEDKVSARYLKALDPVTERFSPELKRRNSLVYDFQEKYHNMHWSSPCEHPMVKSRQNVFVNIPDRTTRECDQRGHYRPQREAEEEKMYLENKQQELQKGFQNYWSERMKMRKEEFERIRHEYRPSIRPAHDTAATGQRDRLAGERSVVSPKISKKAVRSEVDKTRRKTSLSENHKTQRKKTLPKEDTISRKSSQSSIVGQQPLRLSDVDVQVHRVDSSTVQRMRSKDRDNEDPRQKIPEFPAKDLFKFAHKALLGSNFPKECTPSTGLPVAKSKDVQESKSPGLLSRIINSFARSDRVRITVGKGTEDRSRRSEPKESLICTDGSGEGFVSVADMRGQVAKTSNYGAHTGIHHRNKRRQSHSPQMSLTGLRDLRSDYNQNMNSNAMSHARQCVRKTNNNRCISSNALNNFGKNAIAIVQRKHLDIPMLCPSQSRKVSNLPKRPKGKLQHAPANKGECTTEVCSCRLYKHFTNDDPLVIESVPTSLATNGRAITLLTIILVLSLSMDCEDSFTRLTFHPSLSASEQTFSPQETYFREAELSWPNTGPVFGSL